jgi:hypothetical protein
MMTRNLHSYFNFDKMRTRRRLPRQFDVRGDSLEEFRRSIPRRYNIVVTLVHLSIAQLQLRTWPDWYAPAFLDSQHSQYFYGLRPNDAEDQENFLDNFGQIICDHFLPPDDMALGDFLREICYPSLMSEKVLGPLLNHVSIFAPIIRLIPINSLYRFGGPELPDIAYE